MPKLKRISQREVSVADMEGGNFHINKYGDICQVKCCNNPLGATSLPQMCWTVQINTICLFIEGAGNQCKYREREFIFQLCFPCTPAISRIGVGGMHRMMEEEENSPRNRAKHGGRKHWGRKREGGAGEQLWRSSCSCFLID